MPTYKPVGVDASGLFPPRVEAAHDVSGKLATAITSAGLSITGWFDASTLTGADGSLVGQLNDIGGNARHLLATGTARPALKVASLGGKNTLLMATGKHMESATPLPAPISQPYVYSALVKLTTTNYNYILGTYGSDGNPYTANNGLTSLASLPSVYGGTPYLYAGGNNFNCNGPDVGSGAKWRVLTVVARPTETVTYLDGVKLGHLSGQAGGAMVSSGVLQLSNAVFPMIGEFAEGMLLAGDPTETLLSQITKYLSDNRNLALTHASTNLANGVDRRVLTDANGQTVVAFVPKVWNGALVVMNHQQGGTPAQTDKNIGYNQLYGTAQTLAARGYLVMVPTNHGDSWNTPQGTADGAAALTLAETTMNGRVERVIEIGQSMGALLAYTRWKDNIYGARLKGVLTVDGVANLLATERGAYGPLLDTSYGITRSTLTAGTAVGATSLPTAGNYPTVGTKLLVGINTANEETVTTTAASGSGSVAVTATVNTHASADKISDYPTKCAGRDPLLWTTADVPATPMRFRIYASSGDLTVNKAQNADQITARIPAIITPLELNEIGTTIGDHLSHVHYVPSEIVAFCDRCV